MSQTTNPTPPTTPSSGRDDWLTGYDTPVVRASRNAKQHRPDTTQDEPAARCGAQLPDHKDWQVEERDEDRSRCYHQKCYGQPATSQEEATPEHVLDAKEDRRQLDLANPRWSE